MNSLENSTLTFRGFMKKKYIHLIHKKLFLFLLAFAVIGGFVGATASAYYIVEEKEDSTYFIFINIADAIIL